MVKLFISFFTLLSFFSNTNITKSNVKDDIIKVNKAYSLKSTYSFNISYSLYKNKYSKTPLETQNGKYIKYYNQQISNVGSIQSVYLEDALIVTDKSSKSMIVSKPQAEMHSFSNSLNIDSMLNANTEAKYLGEINGIKSYYFKINKDLRSEFESITIHIDTNTYFISKISYLLSKASKYHPEDENETAEKMRLDIVFSNINLKPNIVKSKFKTSFYFKKNHGILIGVGNYKSYSIINNLNIQ